MFCSLFICSNCSIISTTFQDFGLEEPSTSHNNLYLDAPGLEKLVTNRANQIRNFVHVTPLMAASQIYIRYVAICQYSSLM